MVPCPPFPPGAPHDVAELLRNPMAEAAAGHAFDSGRHLKMTNGGSAEAALRGASRLGSSAAYSLRIRSLALANEFGIALAGLSHAGGIMSMNRQAMAALTGSKRRITSTAWKPGCSLRHPDLSAKRICPLSASSP